MYRSIVVGTDGSPTAQRAVGAAADLARRCESVLHVVHAYRAVSSGVALVSAGAAYGAGLTVDTSDIVRQSELESAELLEHALMRVDTSGIRLQTHSRSGNAAEVLLAVASDLGADLIVVGSRGMTGAQRFLGSVPNRVAHHAECHVLIVHTC